MLNWKQAAKQYREVATEIARKFRQDQIRRSHDVMVIRSAEQLRDLILKPKTPFVNLVTGEDVNAQKAQQNLFVALAARDKFIQSYSQNSPQNPAPEKLDNTSSV